MTSSHQSAGTPGRVSTGVPGLDVLLGGGLIPGTLTVLVGSTGIGKTQLAVQFADAGRGNEVNRSEGQRGIIFDMSCRGDSQSHAEYAQRICDWNLAEADKLQLADHLDGLRDHGSRGLTPLGEYLHIFDYRGRRSTQTQWEFDAWQAWQSELVGKLNQAIAFFYGHFVRGVRRCVLDGIDPSDVPDQSLQLELFEYVFQQILRKDSEWVARDLLREHYREHAEQVAARAYDCNQLTSLVSYTAHETLLDDLIGRRLADGDWLAQANTIIYLGKIRDGNRMARAIHVAKHRGSASSDAIVPYTIDDHGLQVPVE